MYSTHPLFPKFYKLRLWNNVIAPYHHVQMHVVVYAFFTCYLDLMSG